MSVSIRNLNIVINGMPIVHDVDMDIADGERVGDRFVRFRQIHDRQIHHGLAAAFRTGFRQY